MHDIKVWNNEITITSKLISQKMRAYILTVCMSRAKEKTCPTQTGEKSLLYCMPFE